MAKFKKMTSIKDTEDGNFGNYKEGVGGGDSPQPLDPAQRAPGVNSEHRKEHNDTEQARTADGKFTYKSVNGKETKYPGRGQTVNPLLTGGQNGIYIEDVDKHGKAHNGVKSQFEKRSGAMWEKYKDKWYQKGSELITKNGKEFQTKVAAEAIWDIAKKKFDLQNNELLGESHVFDEAKKGAPSKEEKIAKQEAKKANAEKYVIQQTDNGIKIVKNKTAPQPAAPSPAPAPQPSPVAPSTPQGEEQPEQQPEAESAPAPQPWGKSGKFTLKDKEDFINQAKKEFPDFDPNFWTDETIEEFLLEDLESKNKNN